MRHVDHQPTWRLSIRSSLRARPALAFIAIAAVSAPLQARPASPVSVPARARYLTIEQLRHRYGDAQGRIVTLDGVEIYYKDEGPRNAPVVLMVHGSASSLRTWDVIAQRMKSRYRVVRFDVGGMGLSGGISDEAAANVTPVQIAKALLDKLGIREVTFVGVSSGGTLGVYLAAAYPRMVKRLILSNTPSDKVTYQHMVEPRSFIDAKAQAEKDGGFQSRHFWDEFLDYFSGRPDRISRKLRDEYYDLNRRTPEKHPFALLARIDDGVEAHKAMEAVRAPTLLIWGARDPLLPIDAKDALERHLANAPVSTIVMPDVGHYPPVEVPERFARIVEAYIEAAVPDGARRR